MVNKNKFIFSFLIASFWVFGGSVLIDIATPRVEAGILSRAKEFATKVARKAKEKVTKDLKNLKAVAGAILKIAREINHKLRSMGFNEQYIRMTIPIVTDKGMQEFGFEYDLGFTGAGDIGRPFLPVTAMFAPPFNIGGVQVPLSGVRFLTIIQKERKRVLT